jgi:hypothetical protein
MRDLSAPASDAVGSQPPVPAVDHVLDGLHLGLEAAQESMSPLISERSFLRGAMIPTLP